MAHVRKASLGAKGLPKGSYVVPFGVCYGFWVRCCNILPKEELHWRFLVVFRQSV